MIDITLESVLDIKTYEDFPEFCSKQDSCSSCILVEKDLIYDDYSQPCKSVYAMVRMIKDLNKETVKNGQCRKKPKKIT